MSTTDGGLHWRKLGGDLGVPKNVKPAEKPAATRPGELVEVISEEEQEMIEMEEGEQGPSLNQGAIESFSPSSMDGRVIWVGTNNGLVKLTRDHGKTWTDVSIPNLPYPGADISCIDSSHQDLGTAYVAVDTHGTGDYKPYFFRTTDFGKTWKLIVDGLPTDQPSGSFARVIRADLKKAGLLYAGTESSMYVSVDNGDHWQPLGLNLPNTSYRDIALRNDDVVVGTYGRSFWILDDVSPLRQITANVASEKAHLFKPGDAIRVRRNVNGDTPLPPEVPHALNPPVGANFYYYLGAKPARDISLVVRDSAGRVVRHMSSVPIVLPEIPPPPIPEFWREVPQAMPLEPGMHRVSWDLRYDNPPAFSHGYEINANPGQTPLGPLGPVAAPGKYMVELTVDGQTFKEPFEVKNDPRSLARDSDLRAQCDLQLKMLGLIETSYNQFRRLGALRADIAELNKTNPSKEISSAAEALDEKLSGVAGSAGGGRRFGPPGSGASAPTYAGIVAGALRQLDGIDAGDMMPTEALVNVCNALAADQQTVNKNWEAVRQNELAKLNDLLAKSGMKPLRL
jgi:hypothetical protein